MNKKIISYNVLSSNSKIDIIADVEECIRKGWQPLGGISVTYEHKKSYHQALVKYIPKSFPNEN